MSTSILSPPVQLRLGLSFVLGESLGKILPLLTEESYAPPLTAGPVAYLGLHSPQDRRQEYAVSLIRDRQAFSTFAKFTIQQHWLTYGVKPTNIFICADTADPLDAWVNTRQWIETVRTTITKMLTDNAELAAKFESTGHEDALLNLGLRLHILITGSPPEQSFSLALRRLAKDQHVVTVMALQDSDMVHPNTMKLRSLLTASDELGESVMIPADRLYVVVQDDAAIDEDMPESVPPEITLGSKGSPHDANAPERGPQIAVDETVGLKACLQNIWDKFGKKAGEAGPPPPAEVPA